MTNELEAKIKEIIPRTYNVKSFRLEINNRIDFKAGQFLSVTLKTEPGLQRYLSISSSPTEKGYLEFTKKITDSGFSKALNSLKAGDYINIKYPLGEFTLEDGYTKIAFISGGIGITPIRSICKYAVDKKLGIDIVLLYGNRTIDDIAFRQDFDQMQKQDSKLKVVHVVCEPTTEIECKIGSIDKQVIQDNVADYITRKFFLCGPPGMVEAMKKILTNELLISEKNIITENFVGY